MWGIASRARASGGGAARTMARKMRLRDAPGSGSASARATARSSSTLARRNFQRLVVSSPTSREDVAPEPPLAEEGLSSRIIALASRSTSAARERRGAGSAAFARARSARSRWRRRAACAAAYPPSTGSLGGAAPPRRSVPGAGADDGRPPVCRSPGPACALPSRRSREPARASPRDARRSRVDVRAGSIRVGSAVASRDAPARDHAPSARGIFKRASPPRRFEDPAASTPPAMKNTRECGDAKAGNPSAAGVDIRRFIGRNRRFTFDRSVLEPRQSKKFFAKAPSNFPRSPNPGITWLSSDRERIHIGEIFAFSPFSRTQHSTVQLSARALRPIRFVWGAQSSGLS